MRGGGEGFLFLALRVDVSVKQEVLAARREESRAWWLRSRRDCGASLED